VEAKRRQFAILGAILVVLAGVLYRQSTRGEVSPEEFSASMRQQGAGTVAAPASGPPPRPGASAQIPAVALARLAQAQPEPADTGRDPFRFESAPVERAPRGSAAAPVHGAPAPAGVVAPTGPQEPPGPPPITLKFIGIARQGAGRLYAVLRDDRGGVFYGADGDVVEGRYRIVRVSADTVDVSYIDGRGRVSIPLSGGRP
jgi:hypothetical protein